MVCLDHFDATPSCYHILPLEELKIEENNGKAKNSSDQP
jgi:hypothetical protein